MPSFTELQDADNEIVTTLGPNKELDSVAQLVKNTNTESPVTVAGASIKPILQLKPVPEIVKPVTPSTRRPHTFIRRPEIVRVQEFAKPGTFMFEMSKPSPRTHFERLQKLNADADNKGNSVTLGRKFVPPNSLTYGFR